MPESAELGVYGFALETVFMKDALARFGIEFEKLAIKEYKNAGDNFARSSMSDAQREHYDALLQSFETTLLTAIATQRATVTGQPIRPEDVKTWIDTGVSSAEQAKRLGMIDDVLYEDEFLTDAHKPVNAAQRFLKRHPYDSAERVAVISLLGTIVTGKSRRSGLPIPIISTQAGSETLMAAFRQAEEDDSTRAIVFYVDSGGGSALASDLIWREVQRIKRKKPVVAVMGQYAASGGYYVLTHAQHIIAAPTTLTGSIGVLVGKFVQEQFNQKYGFQADVVQRGELARIYSSHKAFSEHERDKVTQFISEVYDRFTARVADGRNLSQTRVDELGRGRVYSGADAYELGLVDELGDIELGIMRARELAGLPEHSPVWNVPAPNKYVLPEASDPTTLLRSLQGLLQERALLLHDALITVRH